jgi:DICT domain-containing protein
VRGATLADGEALRDEWTVIVVEPHSVRALIARDLGDHGRDRERRFEYVLTEDPELVLDAGRALMLRIAAEPSERPAFRADIAAPLPGGAGSDGDGLRVAGPGGVAVRARVA